MILNLDSIYTASEHSQGELLFELKNWQVTQNNFNMKATLFGTSSINFRNMIILLSDCQFYNNTLF